MRILDLDIKQVDGLKLNSRYIFKTTDKHLSFKQLIKVGRPDEYSYKIVNILDIFLIKILMQP